VAPPVARQAPARKEIDMTAMDDILNAGPIDVVTRLSRLGDWSTAGPPGDLAAAAEPHPPAPRWADGWWSDARRTPAHPGRLGGPIRPWAVVVHTTDMLPEEWDALATAWTTRPGDGACAHFLIGRDPAHGVLQLAPITRNANHAGGPGHGVFRVTGAGDLHPNLVAVGIEVYCAGGVHRMGDAWRLVEDGKAHGAPLPDSEVTPDPQRPGRGWHQVTDYQREQLGALLADLDAVLAPVPAGVAKVAFAETPPGYAVLPDTRIATHCELDPAHRADPWPELSEWLRSRGA
jgi:N-acetyl-anhydromuramyl-L-alanine amidase AmpD